MPSAHLEWEAVSVVYLASFDLACLEVLRPASIRVLIWNTQSSVGFCSTPPPLPRPGPCGPLSKWGVHDAHAGPTHLLRAPALPAQLHASFDELSPSALAGHVGVVSSVCFGCRSVALCVLLNTGITARPRWSRTALANRNAPREEGGAVK